MSDSPQAKGGIARAAALSPSRRSEIAKIGAQTRWAKEKSVNQIPDNCISGQPARRKQGKIVAEKFSKTHHDAIEAMKDQLLIVLIERAGGEAAISVAEIDATGDRNLVMSLDGTWFHFAVKPKRAPADTPRDINIMRPDYDEH